MIAALALLTQLALAAPRVETAAGPKARAQVQVAVHHSDRTAVALHAAVEEAVTVVRTACGEVASVLSSWPTLVAQAIALFDEWVKSLVYDSSLRNAT